MGQSSAAPDPKKVYIYGIDSFDTADLKAYALETSPSEDLVRVEWIDDSSAKLVYDSAGAAAEALINLTSNAFTHVISDRDRWLSSPWLLRVANSYSKYPAVNLKVRQATVEDVKRKNAHEASRFYLLNPEKNSREQRREGSHGGKKGLGDRDAAYQRRTYSEREHRRRTDNKKVAAFDESMYDDEGEVQEAPNQRSSSRSDDLFGSRRAPVTKTGRLRDRARSASPLREGDGALGFEEEDVILKRRAAARRRSRSPPLPAERDHRTRELFPTNVNSSGLLTPPESKELFPGRRSPHPNKRAFELFPGRIPSSSRGIGALNAAADPFDLSSGNLTTKPTATLPIGVATDVAVTRRGNNSKKGGDLMDRISGGPDSNRRGRLNDLANKSEERYKVAEGFNIRGTAGSSNTKGGTHGGSGFSIRGASSSSSIELFQNNGQGLQKDLFETKIKGRGAAARNKAQDLF